MAGEIDGEFISEEVEEDSILFFIVGEGFEEGVILKELELFGICSEEVVEEATFSALLSFSKIEVGMLVSNWRLRELVDSKVLVAFSINSCN